MKKIPKIKIINLGETGLSTIEKENGEYTIYTVLIEVYGSFGAKMWLKSQGDYVIKYEILK